MNQTSAAVRVRFAPSPTGYLHVGGARTALFNWLYARHCGGSFILRIEDTDVERSTNAMVEGILQGMRWLGLDWDEGPFYQSQRMELYQAVAAKLVNEAHAYYCFCSKAQLEERRETAQQQGRQYKYEGTCRKLARDEAEQRKAAGESCVLRFAVVAEGGTRFDDAVFGAMEFMNQEIEDFVLLRSDGLPTYHLSVVADDVDMKITHVIRGADHLSNTPKQVMLYAALGAGLPIFAHVPLILGSDKSRLSKRHGATSVMSYSEEGIMPHAFRNFLALLGWTPAAAAGEEPPEILDDKEMMTRFGLDAISRTNAVFDRAKLDWFNTEYIRKASPEELLPLVEVEWRRAGLTPGRNDRPWMLATIDLLKTRARSLHDFAVSFRAFFSDDFPIDEAAAAKFLQAEGVKTMLGELGERYLLLETFNEQTAETTLRDFAAEKEVKAGVLINGARVALTGQAVAPSLFAVMVALGKDKTIARLKAIAA